MHFLVAYFITSPLFGRLGDRRSRPRLIAAGVGSGVLATAAAGLARTFTQTGRRAIGVGIGEAAYATISPALLADFFPAERRGRAFAIFYVAIPVGAAVGFLLGGVLERAFGWRAPSSQWDCPAWRWRCSRPRCPIPCGERRSNRGRNRTVSVTLRTLGRNGRYAGTVLGYAAYTFAIGGLAVWMPTFLERVRGQELASADFFVGAVTAVAGPRRHVRRWLPWRSAHGA
jgi:MFS family permease